MRRAGGGGEASAVRNPGEILSNYVVLYSSKQLDKEEEALLPPSLPRSSSGMNALRAPRAPHFSQVVARPKRRRPSAAAGLRSAPEYIDPREGASQAGDDDDDDDDDRKR